MEIRLVNLDRSPDRLASFAKMNPHLVQYRRVSAIDGNMVDRDRLIENQVITPDLEYTKGALGCALSHMVQWRDAIQSDTALTIVEDDVVLAGNFVEETERLISSLPEDWEHVVWGWGFDALMTFHLLPGYSHCTSAFDQESLRKSSQHFSHERIESRLFRLRAGFGTIGYSISPRGARRLLDYCLPLRPTSLHYPGYAGPLPNTGIDNMMAQLYPRMASYVAVPPLVVTDNYHSTSTVQTGTMGPNTQSNAKPPSVSAAASGEAAGQDMEDGDGLLNYALAPTYTSRLEPQFFDDTSNKDEWQREVYLFAQTLMREEKLNTVYDLGCGSGFKLINYLGEFDTTGADMPHTVEFLRSKYPDRQWVISDLKRPPPFSPDLLICADVIEHVIEPDALLRFILSTSPKFVLFSTPDRNLVYPPGNPHLLGPPRNPSHVREWNIDEFQRYLSRFFRVVMHEISNRRQATQMVLCVTAKC